MSKYSDSLSSILRNCESSLGIFKSVGGVRLETASIVEFFNIYKHLEFPKDKLLESMKVCGYNMASLTYIDFRCTYRKVGVLDFGLHGRIDLLANLLLPYVRRSGVTILVKTNITYIVSYLQLLEAKNKDFIKTLSYRYIRLFLVYVMRGDLSHAGMTANFILNQIFISEDLDNSIKSKIDDLLDAGNQVEKLKNEYYEGRDIKHTYRRTASNIESSVDKAKEKVDELKDSVRNKKKLHFDKENDNIVDKSTETSKNNLNHNRDVTSEEILNSSKIVASRGFKSEED